MSLSRRAFIAGLLAAPVVAKLPAVAEVPVVQAVHPDFVQPSAGFAVWKSVDGGSTWHRISPPRRDGKLWLEGARYHVTGWLPGPIHLGPNVHLSGDIIIPPRVTCVFIGSDAREWCVDRLNARYAMHDLGRAEAPADEGHARGLWSTGAYPSPVMPRAPAAETFRLPAPIEPWWQSQNKRPRAA